jgi:hypothetical protein
MAKGKKGLNQPLDSSNHSDTASSSGDESLQSSSQDLRDESNDYQVLGADPVSPAPAKIDEDNVTADTNYIVNETPPVSKTHSQYKPYYIGSFFADASKTLFGTSGISSGVGQEDSATPYSQFEDAVLPDNNKLSNAVLVHKFLAALKPENETNFHFLFTQGLDVKLLSILNCGHEVSKSMKSQIIEYLNSYDLQQNKVDILKRSPGYKSGDPTILKEYNDICGKRESDKFELRKNVKTFIVDWYNSSILTDVNQSLNAVGKQVNSAVNKAASYASSIFNTNKTDLGESFAGNSGEKSLQVNFTSMINGIFSSYFLQEEQTNTAFADVMDRSMRGRSDTPYMIFPDEPKDNSPKFKG